MTTGADTNLVDLTGLSFAYDANATYKIEWHGHFSPAATTTGCGFALNCSTAPSLLSGLHLHQLANTGTLTGGSFVANGASRGVSSGAPVASANPVSGWALLQSGASAGVAQLQYRSEVAAVSTAKAGLLMMVYGPL